MSRYFNILNVPEPRSHIVVRSLVLTILSLKNTFYVIYSKRKIMPFLIKSNIHLLGLGVIRYTMWNKTNAVQHIIFVQWLLNMSESTNSRLYTKCMRFWTKVVVFSKRPQMKIKRNKSINEFVFVEIFSR